MLNFDRESQLTIGGSGGGPGGCFSRTMIVPPTGGVGGCKYLTKTYKLQ